MYICIYIFTYMYLYIYISICFMYTCINFDAHIYAHIYIFHIFIHLRIHIYRHLNETCTFNICIFFGCCISMKQKFFFTHGIHAVSCVYKYTAMHTRIHARISISCVRSPAHCNHTDL